jgi:hypothetical protein
LPHGCPPWRSSPCRSRAALHPLRRTACGGVATPSGPLLTPGMPMLTCRVIAPCLCGSDAVGSCTKVCTTELPITRLPAQGSLWGGQMARRMGHVSEVVQVPVVAPLRSVKAEPFMARGPTSAAERRGDPSDGRVPRASRGRDPVLQGAPCVSRGVVVSARYHEASDVVNPMLGDRRPPPTLPINQEIER